MKKQLFLLGLFISGFASAQSNYCLNFDGVDDYVNLGSTAGNGIRTIECWFMPATNINASTLVNDAFTLIARNDATQSNEYGLYFKPASWPGSNGGKLTFTYMVGSVVHQIHSNSASWSAGQWYHVSVVLDPSSGLSMYVDWTLQTETDATGTSATATANEISAIGCWGDAAIRYFPGRIDEVRYWNRALTQAEINAKICGPLTPASETGLVGYWQMNEGTGSTAGDAGSGGNAGVLVNGPAWYLVNYCTVDVDEQPGRSSVQVAPNPATNMFQVSLGNEITGGSFLLFDETGRLVLFKEGMDGKSWNIDCSGLPEGMYFYEIITAEKISASGRLVLTN